MKRGIILTGGLAAIPGIDKFFANEVKLDVYCADNASDTTINGIMKIAQDSESLQKLSS